MPVEENKNTVREYQVWLPFLLSCVLVGGMIIGTKLKPTPTISRIQPDTGSTQIFGQGRVEELIRFIDAKYVDKVDSEQMVENAIQNLIKELDPHSNYISAKQLNEVNDQLEGNFDGIGIEFLILEDTIVVVKPLPDSPSEAAGILAGDRIVEIGDSTVAGKDIDLSEVLDMLRGERGSTVDIGIKRYSENELRRVTLERDKIPIYSVDAGFMLNEKVGYIKVNRFSANTYSEFMKKVEKMVEEDDLKDLVIDLRQNPGGYLHEATKILSQLFPQKDQLLVYTEGKNVDRNEYNTTGKQFFTINNIAVLIDEGSASASEIIAGAIQDWDRGVIIGRRSFGKGLVQEQYDLKNGGALRLTVSRYFTPSGRSIQKSYTNKENYNHDMVDRLESGELYHKDSINIVDSSQFYTLLEKRPVFAGGGITPDIFIPIDTAHMNDYYVQVKQHIPQFVYSYVEKNRTKLKEYDLDSFRTDFEITDGMIDEMVDYAEAKGVKRKFGALVEIKQDVKVFLKSRIANLLYDDDGFYYIWNDSDPMIHKALEVLEFTKPISELQKF